MRGIRVGHPITAMVGAALRCPKITVFAWLVVATVVTLGVPQLQTAVEHHSVSFVPTESPSARGLSVMDRAFGSGDTRSDAFVVLVDSKGLGSADDAAYRALVGKLTARPARVTEIQDYVGQPQLRSALTSKDGKATFIPVGLASSIGSAPSLADVRWLRSAVSSVPVPPTARVYVTGDPATVNDLNATVEKASKQVTAISLGLLILILMLIYRRFVTILIPLVTIGVSVLVTRGVIAFAGEHGLALSTFTPALIAAIVLGAGTDYTVFLISRYQEELRSGARPDDAVLIAGIRIGKVLGASAGTVIIGSALLAFAKLSILATIGPAIAISIAITAAASLTLTPVLIRWGGLRVAAKRIPSAAGFWSRTGDLVARRPARVLVVGLLALMALAAFFPTMRLSFDERSGQPASTPSNQGYAAIDAHFPANETLPDYLLVVAGHDLRDPSDLAALNTLSQAVAKVPTVRAAYSLTQPQGTPLSPATLASQVGAVGGKLAQASSQFQSSTPGLSQLGGAADQLAARARQLSSGSSQAAAAADAFVQSLEAGTADLGQATAGTARAQADAGTLAHAAGVLATSLQQTHDQTVQAVRGLGQITAALNGDALCSLDPVCNQSRAGLTAIYTAERDQVVPGLATAAAGARAISTGDGRLAAGAATLHDGLVQAQTGNVELATGERGLQSKLTQLSTGTQGLATSIEHIPPGLSRLIDATATLASDAQQASGDLDQASNQAAGPDAAGFYLTADALNRPAFSLAKQLFLSSDGRTARIQIVGTTDPLSASGQDRFSKVQQTAAIAIRGTPLAGSQIVATGAAGFGSDLHDYLAQDARFVALAVLLSVFLILIIALRALIAPLYLLLSVVLSYAAAMGLLTLVWQHALGHHIDFYVPLISFVLLVAVGADYNILLMSRLRETADVPTPATVAHAVSTTGAVITSAGIIFASTFAALLDSSLTGLAELGFGIAAGLLIDTFIVRTLVVPACAALLGPANWWPARPGAVTPGQVPGDLPPDHAGAGAGAT